MKRKGVHIVLIVLIIVVFALFSTAFYRTLNSPDPEDIPLQENLESFKRALLDSESSEEAFLETLNQLTDDELLTLMAETADYLEKNGAISEYSVFAPVAMERLAHKVTPTFMGEIITNPNLPLAFRQIILELGVYGHRVYMENGIPVVQESYDHILREIISSDRLEGEEKDYMTVISLDYLNWTGDEQDWELFEHIISSAENIPWAKGRVVRYMTQADPIKMKECLYTMIENFEQYPSLTVQELMTTLSHLSIPGQMTQLEQEYFEDLPQFSKSILKKYLTARKEGVLIEDYPNLINSIGRIMGRTHTSGMIHLLAEYEDVLPKSFDDTIRVLSQYLYPEIDDLLRSEDKEDVVLALRCVQQNPLYYYKDTFDQLPIRHSEFSDVAKQFSALCDDKYALSPHSELAVKPGNWEITHYSWREQADSE